MLKPQPARAFIPFANGHLHIRYAGKGPPLVMLHECPRSSQSLLPLVERLAPHYCCIAVDITGYGDSDPLAVADSAATIEDFVDALIQLLDNLELGKIYLYGTHTGAAIAVAFCSRQPRRVRHLFLDAPPAFSADEQQSMLAHYLTPITVQRDGSHLSRLWTRVLDQQTYFPFYDRRPQTRLAEPRYDLCFAQRTVMGFLKAGRHYPTAYRAAILYPMADALGALEGTPATVFSLYNDLLVDHLSRLPLKGQRLQQTADISRLLLQPLERGGLPHCDAHRLSRRQSAQRRYLQQQGMAIYTEIHPDFAGTVTLRDPFADPAAAQADKSIAAIDLPGFGFSQSCIHLLTDTDSGKGLLLKTATESGSQLGARFTPTAAAGGSLLYFLAQLGVLPDEWAPEYRPPASPAGSFPLPDLRLSWSGAHLLAAWKAARDIAEAQQRHGDDNGIALLHTERLFHYLIQSRQIFVHQLAVLSALSSRAPGAGSKG